MNLVLQNISEKEIKELNEYLEATKNVIMQYKTTFSSLLNSFLEQIPANAEKLNEIIKELDSEKIKTLVEEAKNLKIQ